VNTIQRLTQGLSWALFFGLVYAWGETLALFLVARHALHIVLNPLAMTTLYLMGMIVSFILLVGIPLILLGGRRLEGRPHLLMLLLALITLGVDALHSPTFEQQALSVLGLVVASITAQGLVKLFRKRPLMLASSIPVLGLIWLGALWGQGAGTEDSSGPKATYAAPKTSLPNILWVIFDTTRADHLSLYGYERRTTPHLDELARSSTVFESAYASAPWTLASHAGMFTSTYSSQHWCNHEHPYLQADRTTIASILTEAGYDTAVFSANPWLDTPTALIRGFSVAHPAWEAFNYTLYNLSVVGRIRTSLIPGGQDKGGRAVTDAFSTWFAEERDPKRPFFAFINYLEAHAPYHEIPDVYRDRFMPDGVSAAEAVDVSVAFMTKMQAADDFEASPREIEIAHALYDGGIAHNDDLLNEVIDTLRQADHLDDTLIIVAGDHGELFGEHGLYGHDLGLFHPLLHVPLLVRWPNHVPGGKRIDAPVQLQDIFPTILAASGLEDKGPDAIRGRSLFTTIDGDADPDRPVFAEYFSPKLPPLIAEIEKMGLDPKHYRIQSVQIGDLRLIEGPSSLVQLYDLGVDADEKHNVAESRAADVLYLKSVLEQFRRDNPMPENTDLGDVPEMDKATRERLKALGYVQ